MTKEEMIKTVAEALCPNGTWEIDTYSDEPDYAALIAVEALEKAGAFDVAG